MIWIDVPYKSSPLNAWLSNDFFHDGLGTAVRYFLATVEVPRVIGMFMSVSDKFIKSFILHGNLQSPSVLSCIFFGIRTSLHLWRRCLQPNIRC